MMRMISFCLFDNVAVISWFKHCNPIDGSSFGDASKTFNLFCNPGAGNPFDFCAVFSKQNWIASPWSRYNIFRITKSDITHAYDILLLNALFFWDLDKPDLLD